MTRRVENSNEHADREGGGGDRGIQGDWGGDREGARGGGREGGGELRVEQGGRGEGGRGDREEGWEGDCRAGGRREGGGHQGAVRCDEEGVWIAGCAGEQRRGVSVPSA